MKVGGDDIRSSRLRAELERAVALVRTNRHAEAVTALRALAPRLKSSDGWRLLVHSLQSLSRDVEAREAGLEGWRDRPDDPDLALLAAVALFEKDEYAASLEAFAVARRAVDDDPELVARHAHALLAAGRQGEAAARAREAFARKPSGVPALVHGLASLEAGELAASADALTRASNSLEDPERAFCEGLSGLAFFWQGETARAVAAWRSLEARAGVEEQLAPFFAIALAMHGDGDEARRVLQRSPEGGAAQLARARVELALGRPVEALAALDAAPREPPELAPLIEAARGRALLLLGRGAEARAVLEPAAATLGGAVGAMVRVDLGRVAGDEGRHEDASKLFEEAARLDPSSQEAARGLELARQRTAWKAALQEDAQGRIAAAQAEAETMRRAFAERERELQMLRARLARSEKAEGKARQEADRTRRDAEVAAKRAGAEALASQQAESVARADAELGRALAAVECPQPLLEALRVAERTYQKALSTELHPAAVAVLFAGALERGLNLLVVRPFDQWLGSGREAFLRGATRQLRPGRVEYFERFVEAFDRSRRAKAPSLGEIARALSRRRETHLGALERFLTERFGLSPAQLDQIAEFVERAKTTLRDPVAHGRALDLSRNDLDRFRRELLFDLSGQGRGALVLLMGVPSAAAPRSG